MEKQIFSEAKWIWNKNAVGTDCYAEFFGKAIFKSGGDAKIRISADSNYALYINGVFAESGQYADYPTYKVYDEFDITRYLIDGENSIAIIVWYYGVRSFTYSIGNPGLIFEIEQDNKTVLCSNSDILSRKSRAYISGKNEMITSQLGLNFHLDLSKEDGWMTNADNGFEKSVIAENMPEELVLRPVKKLNIGDVNKGKFVFTGYFSYKDKKGDNGALMQYAALSFYEPEEMLSDKKDEFVLKSNSDDGIFFIVDLGCESAGYLDIDLEVPEDCQMEVGWGEHLVDGRCRTKVGERNFSADIKLKSGKNRYMNPFRRLGCRYLQIFLHSKKVKIGHIGLRPALYPLKVKEYKSGNILRDTIYKTCENTLMQCMHEHYEDCPWREQSLYNLDSRNQMLCGYYAFGEFDFVKANLKLMTYGLKDDGLFTICFPTDEELKIPSFCLFYIVQLFEYYEYSKDIETVKECFATAKTVIDTFISKIDNTGLARNFEGKNYWNFYEWQPRLEGRDEGCESRYDTCLNATLSIALRHFALLCRAQGLDESPYIDTVNKLNVNIKEKLFDKNTGLFRLFYGQTDNDLSVLANALGFLSGAVTKDEADNILELIMTGNCDIADANVIPATLSMNTFRYEALIKADKEKYADLILDEIDKTYLYMLENGATSFWETIKGDADFHNAGSLCHGWAAMPIYYYETLFSNGERE